MSFQPFADKQEIERLKQERDELIAKLNDFPIPDDEKRFITKRISDITEKLVERAMYSKDIDGS